MPIPTGGGTARSLMDARIAEALEPAPPAWPPPERDRTPVGENDAARYLKGRIIHEREEDLVSQTSHPSLYSESVAEPRLLKTVARFPRDFFDIIDSGRREVRFHIQPILSRSSPPIAETRPSGTASARSYVIILRGAMEMEDDNLFLAIVVHELCHVVLDHPAPIAWPREPDDLGRATARMENDALELADEIGFREETWLLRDLIADLAQMQGKENPFLPDGRMRIP